MIGIDLVLPDFAYLRERATTSRRSSSPTATRTTSARCRGCCASSGRTSVPVVYGGQLTIAMARSKLDEHKLRKARARGARRRATTSRPARSTIEMVHLTHSIPDACGVALTTELGTILITGDYKFDQTPVDGAPADIARLAELGREGLLLLCGDSTNADRPGCSPSESSVGPHLERLPPLPGPHRRHVLRVEHPPRPAGHRRRRASSAARSRWSAARCARTSTSAARSATSTCPRGMLVQPREIEQFPTRSS